jgi:hypothetical protein
MMTEREVEPIMDKLREAERMVLLVISDDNKRDSWSAAEECKVFIWKAMDSAGDMAR